MGLGSVFVGFRPSMSWAWSMVCTLVHILVLVWFRIGAGMAVGVMSAVAIVTMIPAWWQFFMMFAAFVAFASGGGVAVFFVFFALKYCWLSSRMKISSRRCLVFPFQ